MPVERLLQRAAQLDRMQLAGLTRGQRIPGRRAVLGGSDDLAQPRKVGMRRDGVRDQRLEGRSGIGNRGGDEAVALLAPHALDGVRLGIDHRKAAGRLH